MNIIESLKPWLGRKSVRGAILIIFIIVTATLLRSEAELRNESEKNQATVVSTTSATEYAGTQSLSLIGNVRAFSEAIITSERAGRVVSVNTSLGQQVLAGTILATLENASERAAVLQAEGVYDAAVAAAAQSGVSVDEAKNNLLVNKNSAISSIKSAYNTANGIVLNNIDTFFSDPDSRIPGLRIDGRGFTAELNNSRIELQSILPIWQMKTTNISASSDLRTEIAYASQNIQRIVNIIDRFIVVFDTQEGSSRYSESELIAFINTFTDLRSTLIITQSSLDNALTSLTAAEEGLKKAELASTGGITSAADAQVKQALGALRSAQANLAKTILRTPISGTVNSLSIRTGDFINSFERVAVIANNGALEIVTYISDVEKNLISVGDTVIIEGTYEGIVTNIAPAVDFGTRKTEVRIATEGEDITNGDTVRITKNIDTEASKLETIRIPLTAVRFDRENGSVFLVEEGKLSSRVINLGTIRGNSVEVLDGLSATDEFVVDARGLVTGEAVEVQN